MTLKRNGAWMRYESENVQELSLKNQKTFILIILTNQISLDRYTQKLILTAIHEIEVFMGITLDADIYFW